MKAARAGALIVVDALARDLPPRGLDALSPRAASLLNEGNLEDALRELGVDGELARVGALWPRASKPALERFDGLPAHSHFVARLAQTLVYVAVVLLIEVGVVAVLRAKVFPVVTEMSRTHGHQALDLVNTTLSLVLGLWVPVAVWVLLGASGWSRLPGWGQQLRRARETALAAALAASGAPEDVRAAAHRGFRTLNEPALGVLELDEAHLEAKAAVEAALERFLVAVRLVSLVLLSLVALGTLVGVYGVLARLAWLH